ncbi:TadE/TadG family type IV pilus assembly protein [Thermodesulfobacteriota bacterium]
MRVKVFNNGERGASVLEFAIVLPILLVLLFGVIEFGFILYNKAMLTNAAREGVRAGIVAQSPRLDEDGIRAIVEKYCEDMLVSFGGSTVPTVVATLPASLTFGNDLEVEVTYPYSFLLIPSFVPVIPPAVDLQARVIMKYE